MLYTIDRPKLSNVEMAERLRDIGCAYRGIVVMDNGYFLNIESFKKYNTARPYMYYYDEGCKVWIKNPKYDIYMRVVEEDES